MTNEAKAREIANLHKIVYIRGLENERGTSFIECASSAYQMAQWKDQQFKELLEKKKSQYSQAVTTFDVMRKKVIQELINELFKEN